MSDLFAIDLYNNIEDTQFGTPDRWRASSIASCPRAQYFKRQGVEPLRTLTKARQLRNQAGHHFEAAIREALQKIYPNLLSNVRFKNDELDLGGEIDNYNPDTKEIIEIKTIGVRAPRYKKVTEDRHHLKEDAPYLHHEIQQHVYVKLMHTDGTLRLWEQIGKVLPSKYEAIEPRDWDVEKITYAYITLEGLILTYSTLVKPEVMQMVDKRLEILNEAWEKQEPPACLCQNVNHPVFNSTMQYCDFRTILPKKDTPDHNCCSVELLNLKENI